MAEFTKAQLQEIERERIYWTERRHQLLAEMEQDERKLVERLTAYYKREAAAIKREIAAFYAEYGKDNVIEYRMLKQVLSPEDLTLLMERMDDFAKKYPQFAYLMPVRESIYKLDRLQGLQYSILVQELEIGAIEQKEFDRHLRQYAMESANLAAEELGFGTKFYAINAQIVTDVVTERWSNAENFSARIWAYREKLAATLNTDIAQGFARGMKYDDLARMLMDYLNEGEKERKNAMRLVFTEGTFIFNEANAQVNEQEYEFYQLSPVSESWSMNHSHIAPCDICRGIADNQKKEPVRFSERVPGENFPPLHPRCRCSFEIVVPDQDDWIERYVAKHGGDYIQERDRPDLNYLHPKGT